MQTCYTVGYDSFVPGIIAKLNPAEDAIIVGKDGRGRLAYLSSDDPPKIEEGRIMTAFLAVARRDEHPSITLAGSITESDKGVAVLVMVDTSRTVDHDDSSLAVAPVAGSPYTVVETYSRMGKFLSVQGLYALLPGDALRMRPLGVSSSDWARQRVILCEAGEAGPVLKVISRAEYHKGFRIGKVGRGSLPLRTREGGTTVMSTQ